jgi:O-antigen ligase
VLFTVVAAETALLALGWRTGYSWLSAALAAGIALFLIAFRWPDVAWGLTWAAFPFSVERVLPGGSAIRLPTEAMIPLVLAGWASRGFWQARGRLPGSPLHLPLAVLAAVALASSLLGAHPVVGLKAWVVSAGYAAFGYLYFCCASCDAARRDRWVRLAMISGAAWGLYGAARIISLGAGLHAAYGAARPFFPEHGTYSAFLAMLLPLALLLAVERRGPGRWGYALVLLSLALGIVFSFTRAAWLSVAVVLPLTVLIWSRRRRSARPFLVSVIALSLAVAVVSGVGARRSLTRHAESITDTASVSNLERLNRWIAALNMAENRPWMGVGYGAYPVEYPRYRRKLIVTEESTRNMGAHSEPLRLLSETGVIGLGAALWLLLAAARVGLRTVRDGDPGSRLLALGILAGLGTYAVHGLFNSYLAADKVAVPFWTGLGVLAALGRATDPRRGPACGS